MKDRKQTSERIANLSKIAEKMEQAWEYGNVKEFIVQATIMRNIIDEAESTLKEDIFNAYLKGSVLP